MIDCILCLIMKSFHYFFVSNKLVAISEVNSDIWIYFGSSMTSSFLKYKYCVP